MTKCDLCKYSHLEKGKLVCPFLTCTLNDKQLKDIYDVMKKMNK